MEKTKVLLVCGMHEFGRFGKPRQNRKFFRKAIVPFLEEYVREGRGRAIVIYENSWSDWVSKQLTDEMKVQVIEQTDDERKARSRTLIECCKEAETASKAHFRSGLDQGISSSMDNDWGFGDVVISINRKRPGSVTGILEPVPEVEVFYSALRREMLVKEMGDRNKPKEERLKSTRLWIENLIIGNKLRDLSTHALAVKLADECPDRSIIIPRGLNHAGIAIFFNPQRFEVIEKTDIESIRIFTTEAAIQSYRSRLTDEEMERYARLELACNDYIENLNFGIRLLFEKSERIFPGIHSRIFQKAKEHALRQETQNQKK